MVNILNKTAVHRRSSIAQTQLTVKSAKSLVFAWLGWSTLSGWGRPDRMAATTTCGCGNLAVYSMPVFRVWASHTFFSSRAFVLESPPCACISSHLQVSSHLFAYGHFSILHAATEYTQEPGLPIVTVGWGHKQKRSLC